ncbi:MAG: hypothetical protein M3Z14_05215 [Candidatus Eremiobacteraeota bacterium]|nr:hypothetical protein [Candidatus Eremiobacteraeota bacterium]
MIAAVLVCAAGGLTALGHHPSLPLQIRGVRASGSPSASRRELPSDSRAVPFVGEAPWALSALPECLSQQTVWRGMSRGALRARVPPGAQAVEPGAVLHYNDCTITVRRRDALVVRGEDRFHIPPASEFFARRGQLFILRSGKHAELRAYNLANT